jgi:hypothetical protein
MTTQKALPNDLIDSLLSNYKKPSSISLKYQAASAAAFLFVKLIVLRRHLCCLKTTIN